MTVKFANYCRCGAAWKGQVEKSALDLIETEWHTVHSGQEHSSCDAKTASQARKAATGWDKEAIYYFTQKQKKREDKP